MFPSCRNKSYKLVYSVVTVIQLCFLMGKICILVAILGLVEFSSNIYIYIARRGRRQMSAVRFKPKLCGPVLFCQCVM